MFVWKTLLVVVRMALNDYQRLQALGLLLSAFMVAWSFVRWPPYYHQLITHVQVRWDA